MNHNERAHVPERMTLKEEKKSPASSVVAGNENIIFHLNKTKRRKKERNDLGLKTNNNLSNSQE
jgi:hypothetical protein